MQQLNHFSAKIEHHHADISAAVERVLARGWFVLGPEVQQFEEAFAQYLGAPHCVSVANGTDAIELGLKALGVVAGDKVATIANASMYTTIAVLAIGAEPYFMDVDIETRGATLAQVQRAVQAGVKAVVVTHLYGLAIPEIKSIAEYCSQHHIPLLEDCAQAHGAEIEGKRVGTFGDASSFSFYPTKNLGALGDGGAVVTKHANVFEKLKQLRQYGWSTKYEVAVAGGRNSRLDEMQAAILLAFLPHLDAANARRREIATRYSTKISHPDVKPPAVYGLEYVAHLYVICSPDRDGLRAHLKANNIASEVHYPIPDYKQPIFGGRYADMALVNTEQLTQEILTLPCYPEMSDEAVDSVIAAINGWKP